jgi:hypothetical protein
MGGCMKRRFFQEEYQPSRISNAENTACTLQNHGGKPRRKTSNPRKLHHLTYGAGSCTSTQTGSNGGNSHHLHRDEDRNDDLEHANVIID